MKDAVSLVWLDVFAEEPFGGNPLAVLDGQGLPEEGLLKLTRELSLSEVAFCYPPSQTTEADARVRIFTQAKEIPFAGHPVLGSATALLLSGRLPWKAPTTTVRLEVGIGIVPVTIEGATQPERARFSHSRIAVPTGPLSDDRLVWIPPAIGLGSDRIGVEVSAQGQTRKLVPQLSNGGALQLMVPVQTPEDVDAIFPSYRDVVVAERMAGAELGMLTYAFLEPPRQGQPVRVRARLFASDSPLEDPATGSAAAALAVLLHHHQILAAGQVLELHQGPPQGRVEGAPGRRSLLRAQCDGQSVLVEGRVREVLRGAVHLSL